MSSTPVHPRTLPANTSLGLKLTPQISPYSRSPRSPNRTKSIYESGLSLKQIIGTTVSSPTAFDTLSTARIFAYTAGAAAVVVNVDDSSKFSQRFFRARPTAVAVNPNGPSSLPGTPTNVANDSRNRSSVLNLRDTFSVHTQSPPHTSFDWGESPVSKTWTSRERIKAATCLSMSRDGKFLAVGETGYSPRVLIFSLQDTSSDTPLAILNDHTYGVRAVAFSADQRYLASIGAPNDGFLHVWAINQRTGAAKLHSSNKCTSSIKQMIWLGNSVVTVGTRHIKLWKVEDQRNPSPSKRYALDGAPLPTPAQPLLKTLIGRNCLLGPLVEATFTAVAAISDRKAIVCSEKGDICLLENGDGPKLVKLSNVGFPITCIAFDPKNRRVRIGGRNGTMKFSHLDDLLTPRTPPESPNGDLLIPDETGHLCAMGYAASSLVTIDSKHMIKIAAADSDTANLKMQDIPFPAHGDSVLGVQLLSKSNRMDATFLTWATNGTVVFWDLNGRAKGSLKIPLEQLALPEEELPNHCLNVRASKDASYLVSGDRYGVLRVIDTTSKMSVFETKAHMSDIHDIVLYEDEKLSLIATCGRDRTVQLFRRTPKEWVLVQTLDEHSASVCGLFFAENAEKLVSCSSDRTIHIRQLARKMVGKEEVLAVLPLRIITLKASPVSMALCHGDQEGNFVTSLLDRTVATYEMSTGRLVNSFRSTDGEGADAVVLDSLVMGAPSSLPGKPTILAGVSGTDKSVRVYDSNGAFLDREWGHTAGVTDVALLESPDSEVKTMISTGSDGTIMIWELAPRPPDLVEQPEASPSSHEASPAKETTSARPPLRRVLSKAELAEFQKSSPVATPNNKGSPPRTIRRKSSRYGGLSNQSPTLNLPTTTPTNSKQYASSNSDDSSNRRVSARARSRTPPRSPKGKSMRRPSLASLDSRSRMKGSANFSEFGTLNMATEQACRTLRAYRKRLLTSEDVKEGALRELDNELRLTQMALGEKSMKSKALSETVLAGLLDEYSDKLMSMFDEKLRLTQLEASSSNNNSLTVERPRTAGAPPGYQ
ncbi:WD repeat protein-like protein [Xylogone sp. PMI_703]|nr:WD repeat protein-like protein [Xylogone sp. PMI_703]